MYTIKSRAIYQNKIQRNCGNLPVHVEIREVEEPLYSTTTMNENEVTATPVNDNQRNSQVLLQGELLPWYQRINKKHYTILFIFITII